MKGAFFRLVTELVVIIAGVLIALAIDEWRGNIKDAKTEAEYVQQLLADLQTTIDRVSSAAAGEVDNEIATTKLLALFENSESEKPESVRSLLPLACEFSNPVPVLGTADTLVATGDLRLIRNATSRSKITQYLSQTRDYWLTPLYSGEDAFVLTCRRIKAIASMHGIYLEPGKGPYRRKAEPDIEGFLGNTEAYIEVTRLVGSRAYFTNYEKALSSDASELQVTLRKFSQSE